MSQEMEKFRGTSDDGLEDDMEMEVKEEEDASGFFIQEEEASGDQIQIQGVGMETDTGSIRRSRLKKEKERTKLRERHRRAITARILAGLRRHGNYNLRVRADINDVITALAREAGWVVLPDGTAFPSRSSPASSSSPQTGLTEEIANDAIDSGLNSEGIEEETKEEAGVIEEMGNDASDSAMDFEGIERCS